MKDWMVKRVSQLDDRDPTVRLRAAGLLAQRHDPLRTLPAGSDVNNHIHTTYSFSPYSPARAVWESRRAGLAMAGIMDHDTAAGTPEFRSAARLMRLPVTAGVEMRVSFAGTGLERRRINHPDQEGAAYLALHALSDVHLEAVDAFFQPVRAAREKRNRIMAARLDRLARAVDCSLDYDQDVLPLTESAGGGTVTERHLLYALARKLDHTFADRAAVLAAIHSRWDLVIPEPRVAPIVDPGNLYFLYDLLGLLKSALLPRVYEPATQELTPIEGAVALAKKYDLIAAYPYLGDIEHSVTGDKAAQRFEDAYLDELFVLLHDLGIRAVTYMPSRNTRSQLERVRALCRQHGFLEISGEDINQPAQPFVCRAMRHPSFAALYDTAWALIGHEQAVTEEPGRGLLSAQACHSHPLLSERIRLFAERARTSYL